MFKKLISGLPFSPALVGQLGFYAKRLRKEEAVRKMGLVFVALSLVVQSFAVFQPPEAANAASSNDLIYGGFSTKQEFIDKYLLNTGNLKDLLDVIGITRQNIEDASIGTWNSHTDGGYSWGHLSRFSYAQGERSYTVPTSGGGSTTFYYRPLTLSDTLAYTIQNGSTYEALVGKTNSGMQFAFLRMCGNLVLKVTPPPVPCPAGTTGTYPNCTVPPKMCEIQGKTNLLASDPNCKPDMCTIAGKTNLLANDPNCKPNMCTIRGKTNLLATDPSCKVTVMCTVEGKTNLPAADPGCVAPKMCEIQGKTTLLATDPNCKLDPVATCDSLSIDRIASNYQLTTTAKVTNGATVQSYTYTIKRDGQVIETKKIDSTQLSNIYVYSQSKEGSYTVTVSVATTAGAQTSPNCAKSFNIAPPERCQQNPDILKISPECQPCPGDATMWIKDVNCATDLVQTKSAKNVTQGNVDAQTVAARANDKITYVLTMENKGKARAEATFVERIDDVAEYANVIDTGGGSKSEDPDTKTAILTWPKVTIEPGQKVSRIFTVQVMSTIPSMGTGTSNATSYDCKMMNTFGNQVTVAVDCPIQKQIVETVTTQLPHTGAGMNVVISASVLAVVAFLYARARQLKTEVRLIRRDFNTGTI